MADIKLSVKQLQINKANSQMVLIVGIAAFVIIFSLVASKALLSQSHYQKRVISEKSKAVDQLKENIGAVNSLVNSYKDFVSTPQNVLEGDPSGNGDKDGDNAKIILDALPSKYDFPALATSLEKILSEKNFNINSITGTDDEINQQKTPTSATPTPIEIPFEISVSGTYSSTKQLIQTLQASIRPIKIQSVSLVAQGNNINTTINAITYYQPTKDLNITSKDIK